TQAARLHRGARGSTRVGPAEDLTVAEIPQMPPTPPVFKLGDRVKIRRSGYRPGRIVELRGALGPGGAQIYRVRYRRKPPPHLPRRRRGGPPPPDAEVREAHRVPAPREACAPPNRRSEALRPGSPAPGKPTTCPAARPHSEKSVPGKVGAERRRTPLGSPRGPTFTIHGVRHATPFVAPPGAPRR